MSVCSSCCTFDTDKHGFTRVASDEDDSATVSRVFDGQSHGFAQFHPPLVKRIDAPDGRLAKHFVLIQGNQSAQTVGSQVVHPHRAARAVARITAVRRKTGGLFFAQTFGEQ